MNETMNSGERFCEICGAEITGLGNDPIPVIIDYVGHSVVCDDCNDIVIAARMAYRTIENARYNRLADCDEVVYASAYPAMMMGECDMATEPIDATEQFVIAWQEAVLGATCQCKAVVAADGDVSRFVAGVLHELKDDSLVSQVDCCYYAGDERGSCWFVDESDGQLVRL